MLQLIGLRVKREPKTICLDVVQFFCSLDSDVHVHVCFTGPAC